MMHSVGGTILVPQALEEVLDRDAAISASARKTLADFGSWLAVSRAVFFPEYTDHGPAHVSNVLATAVYLMSDEVCALLTPRDAAALIVATVLHDCAMHLTEDGFVRLASGRTALKPIAEFDDKAWPALWEEFCAQAIRFSPADNLRLFGTPESIPLPNLAKGRDWTARQYLLIGEFIRRQHPRFAHQVAMAGFQAPSVRRCRSIPA